MNEGFRIKVYKPTPFEAYLLYVTTTLASSVPLEAGHLLLKEKGSGAPQIWFGRG